MRQQNLENDPKQAKFMELLPRLRNGESTLADYELLATRFPTEINKSAFENAIRIFNDNESVDKYNLEKLIDLKTPITEIRSHNSNSRSKNGSASEFGGLCNSIYLSTGCHVTLTMNTWIQKGKLQIHH
jgi:hypothetical protein